MNYFRPDAMISFVYHPKSNVFGNIQTSIKPEYVGEVLENWLYTQIRRGASNKLRVAKERYKIKIGLDLSDDRFGTESDTGNKSLTAGIVIEFTQFISDLSDLERQALLSPDNN